MVITVTYKLFAKGMPRVDARQLQHLLLASIAGRPWGAVWG
jgi:hypothetical protein